MNIRGQVSIEVGERRLGADLALPGGAASVPMVLFVHDQEGSARDSERQAEALVKQGYGACRLDLSGSGRSRASSTRISRHKHVEDVLGAYDALFTIPQAEATEIFVVGHGYGAYIAACAAGERPLAGLVMRSPRLYADDELSLESAADENYTAFRERIAPEWHNQALQNLRQSHVPVLVVTGTSDTSAVMNAGMSYLAAARGARAHKVVETTGRGWTSKGASAYQRLILDWLGERAAVPVLE